LGNGARQFTLKSRLKTVDGATRDFPPSNTYTPNFGLVEDSKFSATTFGFGSRCNVTGQIKNTPGPGTYRISSVFDRFKRVPAKQYLELKKAAGV
jgi:hypothetical protein